MMYRRSSDPFPSLPSFPSHNLVSRPSSSVYLVNALNDVRLQAVKDTGKRSTADRVGESPR